MSELPMWLGALGTLLVIAASLGAAVAVYKTNLQAASLAEARRIIGDLRGEITDYERQEQRLKDDLALHKANIEKLELDRDSCARRITVLEDLVTKRSDDAELRAGIAQLNRVVDERIIVALDKLTAAVVEGKKP